MSQQQLHGLRYPVPFLAALPVLADPKHDAQPVRLLDPRQFDQLHLQYLTSHAPDGVLFPFLHGLEGNNHAQNAFFASARAPGDIPPFRGLIWVAADDDDDDDADEPAPLPEHDSSPRTAHDLGADPEEDIDELDDSDDDYSTESSLDSFGPMDMDVDLDDHMHIDHPVPPPPHPFAKLASPPPPHPSPAPAVRAHASRPPHPPPPSVRPVHLTSSFVPRELLTETTGPDGTAQSVFVEPKVPEGISLRNFGIQVPIFATLSDVVVYSPVGNTRAAHALAARFAEAIAHKRAERAARHPDPAQLVQYNVFVLDAPPAALAHACPHLVVHTDSLPDAHTDGTDAHTHGDPALACLRANTVDFARREKEEMRDLTQASELVSVTSPDADVDAASLSGTNTRTHWDPSIGQVFLGNANDVPLPPDRCLRVRTGGDEFDESAFEPAENTPTAAAGFDVCIECHDYAPFPSAAHIRAAEDHFIALERRWIERCVQEADPATDSDALLPPRPPPSPAAIVHLPFPSSPPGCASTLATLMPFLAFLDRMLQPPARITFGAARAQLAPTASSPPPSPVHASAFTSGSLPPPSAFPSSFFSDPAPQTAYTRVRSTSATYLPSPPSSSPSSSPSSQYSASSSPSPSTSCTTADTSMGSQSSAVALRTRPAKVLVYSADGYTESSVLALTLLMARAALALPHAYLALQLTKRRSFFVYPQDLAVLRRIEARFEKDRARAEEPGQHSPPPPQAKMKMLHPPPPVVPVALAKRAAAQSVSFADPPARLSTHPLRSQSAGEVEGEERAVVVGRPRAQTLPEIPLVLGENEHQVWFDDPRFDGSFPSRVLPFLYLGNLNHAVNAYMLHALGITHVVSVGECALLPPPNLEASTSAPDAASVARAHPPTPPPPPKSPRGHSSLWSEERAGRIKVLDIKGVCDDGIDTLAPQLEPICEWIDRAREEGGKVLVHCRVGVSRSATVTIAYVMKHLGLPLVDAYLIVRSRRLSVLIQPNMRLLYNLLGWELALARERAAGEDARLRVEMARSLNWPYLAKQVHALNEKYLH